MKIGMPKKQNLEPAESFAKEMEYRCPPKINEGLLYLVKIYSQISIIFTLSADNKSYPDPNTTLISRGCQLGDQFHSAGASWHPYLPPNGFDTCTVCQCDINTLEIKCPRTICPPLHCSEKVAYRPDKKACCKVCPEVIISIQYLFYCFNHLFYFFKIKIIPQNHTSTNDLRDQGSAIGTITSPEEIMKNGGCKSPMGLHENGMEWHPIIASHGEQKCIRCRCKVSYTLNVKKK
jgi:von Willebrand factor type C domain